MPAPVFRVLIIGPSMEPALANGDLVWARRGGARPGRIGVFPEPGRPDLIVVKRLRDVTAAGWWVEGDNADASRDSRQYGRVPASDLLGTLIRRW